MRDLLIAAPLYAFTVGRVRPSLRYLGGYMRAASARRLVRLSSVLNPPQQSQQTVKNRERMGGTTGNIQVHGYDRASAVVYLAMVDVRSAGDGAGTHRN